MGFNSLIHLVNIDSVQNLSTGKRQLTITSETPVYADRQEVGMQEFYVSRGSNVKLTAVFEVPSDYYHDERYILSDNKTKQYEIVRVGKGRSLAYIKLSVKKVDANYLMAGVTNG